MARGGYRPGAGRPPGSGKAKNEAENSPETGTIHDENAENPCATDLDGVERTPLEYMLAVMNDISADASRRDRLAIAAAPFVHGKIPDGGKKDAQRDAAKDAVGGKFKPSQPPKLKVVS